MKMLMVSHQATRTGAPIFLLNVAKLIRQQVGNKYSLSFLVKDGPVMEDFKVFPTTLVTYKEKSLPWFLYKAGQKFNTLSFFKKLKFSERRVKKSLKDVDVVLCNTLTVGDILPLIKKYFKGPVVSYIHELHIAPLDITTEADVSYLLHNSDRFMVCSMAVKNFLVNYHGLDGNKIDLISSYVPDISFQTNTKSKERKEFIVGGVGTTDWRKSPDIFVQVARQVLRQLPDANIKFIWKGGNIYSSEYKRLQYDIKNLGIDKNVFIEESSAEMGLFYDKIDVFLLTSREDPYPLVVLEAANAKVPTICFERAGGAPEFVSRSHGGISVPYLNLESMAGAVLFYYNNEEDRSIAGENAKIEMELTHQNGDLVLSQFESTIDKAINSYRETKQNGNRN